MKAYVVMGHEFYSSWPVRVFLDEDEANEFARTIRSRYDELCAVIDADRAEADQMSAENPDLSPFQPEQFARKRAQRTIAETLDPNAGGLELTWRVAEVPMGPLVEGSA